MTTAIGESTCIIITHESFRGGSQEFVDFCNRHHAKKTVSVSHQFPSLQDHYTHCEVFVRGKQQSSTRYSHPKNQWLTYSLNFFQTLWYGYRTAGTYDIYIGAGAFNVLPGLIMRATGKAKKVAFYCIDFVEEDRFRPSWANFLYRLSERIAFFHSDITWNAGEKMSQAREKLYGERTKNHPQLYVPTGAPVDEGSAISTPKKPCSIVYSGSLTEECGVELAINAIPLLLKKIPSASLHIVGDGPMRSSLENLVSPQLREHVTFHGYVDTFRERTRWLTLIKQHTVGIAPYVSSPTTYKKYSDVTKPKDYMACGLPVITTTVIPLAEDINRLRLGKVAQANATSIATAAQELLENPELIQEMSSNAQKYIADFSWDHILQQALLSVSIST